MCQPDRTISVTAKTAVDNLLEKRSRGLTEVIDDDDTNEHLEPNRWAIESITCGFHNVTGKHMSTVLLEIFDEARIASRVTSLTVLGDRCKSAGCLWLIDGASFFSPRGSGITPHSEGLANVIRTAHYERKRRIESSSNSPAGGQRRKGRKVIGEGTPSQVDDTERCIFLGTS